MSNNWKRMYFDDKIQEAYERLQKNITRGERLSKFGAERAKIYVRLSSQIKTRSTAARIARAAQLDAEYDFIMENGSSDTIRKMDESTEVVQQHENYKYRRPELLDTNLNEYASVTIVSKRADMT